MNFRTWLHELWLQNCDEHREYGEMLLTQEQYFQMYKYWLKREFRHQQQQEKAVAIDSNFVVSIAIDDKLEYTGATLLSRNQNRLIKTLKDNNEK